MNTGAQTRADTTDPLLQRLQAVVEDAPELKEAAMVYGAILPLMRDAVIDVKPLAMSPELVSVELAQGQPVLAAMEVELDGRAVGDLLQDLAAAVAARGETAGQQGDRDMAAAARSISRAVAEGRLDMSTLLPEVAAGNVGPVREAARGMDLEPALLWLLAQTSLMPALFAARRQLTRLVEGAGWEKGTCPVCGAWPVFGELQGNNLAKHLRCGRCGADWRFRRLQCHRCGNEDHSTLGLLYPEGRGDKERIEVCDRCKGYLKVITSFSPTPPEMLPVEDLATAFLDPIARNRGYGRPPAGH